MDIGYKLELENPRKKANFLSKLVFGWVLSLLYKGKKRGLVVLDLFKALDNDKSHKLGDKLEKYWDYEVQRAKLKGGNPSLLRALAKTFLYSYMMWGILFFIDAIFFRALQPVVLSYLLSSFISADAREKTVDMYLWSTLLIGMSGCSIFMMHHTDFGFAIIGMRIRIALSSLLYRKITRLNQKSLGETAAGQVINLLSNDVNRFDLVILALHVLWIAPIQVMIVSYFLWQQVGISCLTGIITMLVISLPIQGSLGKLTGNLRLRIAIKTDRRVKLMSEIISSIQVIKMYAWEKPFEKMIRIARVKEIKDITYTSYIRGFFSSCHIFMDKSTLFLTLMCYVLLGNVLTADVVYSVAQFFNILQFAMAILYPVAIALGAEALISIDRLQEFFLLEERQSTEIEELREHEIQLKNVSASWTDTDDTLKNMTLQIPPGTLCAIVGPVGAGKSSFLQVLLGELPVKLGNISLGGEISYASQKPWLFQSTVRSNILFGQPYDKSWYGNVVDVCALHKDFEQFPQGDKTIVGDRGVSLSGGQRARINLARAIYRHADIYLLDDPLSAVDTHVGRHLFDECIHNHLKGKTRIIVTHQLQYLKKANLIVVINDGQIEAQGTFEELSRSKLDFTKLLVAADESLSNEKIAKFEEIDENVVDAIISRKTSILSVSNSIYSNNMEITYETPVNEEDTIMDPDVNPFFQYFKAMGNWYLVFRLLFLLFLAQSASTATDFWVAYWTEQETIRNSKNSIVLEWGIPKIQLNHRDISPYAVFHSESVNISTIGRSSTFQDLFDKVQLNDTIYDLIKTTYAMYIYGALVLAAIVFTLSRSLLFYKLCMLSSKNLHSTMFHVLLEAPMRFFDTNPSGRILNRFSKDMGAIDEVLPRVLMAAIQMPPKYITKTIKAIWSSEQMEDALNAIRMVAVSGRFFGHLVLLGAVFMTITWTIRITMNFKGLFVIFAFKKITMIISGIMVNVGISNPYIIIAMVLIGVLFWVIRGWFISSSRLVKLIEGATKSPVFSHITSTLNGIPTIRASKAEQVLIDQFDEHQDVHTSAWYLTLTCMTFFGLWLDLICLIFIACVTFSFVIMQSYTAVSGSFAGLAITQSLLLCDTLQHGMRQTAEVVNQLTSVERVLQYTKIDSEKPFNTPKDKLPPEPWPNRGKIEFRNLSLKYIDDDPPVLENLSFTVQPGEKIGIVGRTGAGKSSLISALFRLAPTEGTVLIDDVDTKDLGFTDLRRAISIIPQEPVLFAATMRYNLDPFGEFDDAKLWKVLEEVELKDAIESLDFQVSECGNNFSLGQRQLVCLARATLRNNKILIMDEATSNVDPRTDSFIQATIRRKFKDCTVLTIAHRLNTIMDSDRVLVMSFGTILEFDHPYKLLEIPDGHFHNMVLETGPVMYAQLKDVSLESYNKKNN